MQNVRARERMPAMINLRTDIENRPERRSIIAVRKKNQERFELCEYQSKFPETKDPNAERH